MGTDNAFAELGLAPDATDSEVKAAWRRLVSQWHPDRNSSSDAVARMQRINRAFEEIRKAGPRVRTAHAQTSGAASASASRGARGSSEEKRASSRRAEEAAAEAEREAEREAAAQPQRRPIYRKMKLTLEEAAAGCIKVLQGKITDTCVECAGAGHQVLGGNCAQCGGSGAVSRRSFFGWPAGYSECNACLGGGIARRPCKACAGNGKMAPRSYKVSVRIPPGVRSGDQLHVDGRRPRPGSPPADLEIRVEVADHAFFKLDADGTVRCDIPVDGFAWIANRSVQVPTVAGLQAMKLKRDQLSYRLKGHGFPVARSGARGDQVVNVLPVFPDQLSADQEILLDQLLATTSGPGGHGVDSRLRAWNHAVRAWERAMPKREA